MNDEFTELIAMKKTRKRPKEGDVFALQPISGMFYFGKVIQTDVKSTDSFVNGATLIYVYSRCSHRKELPYDLETAEFLIPPQIVNFRPWLDGYFETVGNIPVTEAERNVPFGFWDLLRKRFIDINQKELNNEPEYWGCYGLGSYGVVGRLAKRALESESGRLKTEL